MTKLLKIVSSGVDIVLIAVEDDYKKFEVIDKVVESEIAEFQGEVYIDEVIDIPKFFVELDRPFVG